MTEPSTETRDWAEVRKAAVHAVLQAASDYGHDGLVAGDAEKLADAVLAVCDEEAINRMADEFVAESRLISLGAEDGKATLKAAPAREIVAHWVMASWTWWSTSATPTPARWPHCWPAGTDGQYRTLRVSPGWRPRKSSRPASATPAPAVPSLISQPGFPPPRRNQRAATAILAMSTPIAARSPTPGK